MRRTKIVATIGPACEKVEILKKLIAAGMNVARFNFSHGSHEEHKKRFENLKIASAEMKIPVALLLDTKGPEIRIGSFKEDKIFLEEGDIFTLTTEEVEGTKERVSITYKNLPQEVNINSVILLDDGLIELKVVEKNEKEIKCKVVNGGELKSKKGVNVPGVSVNLPAVTDQDKRDILFGIEMGIDFIAASFVRKAADVLEIRKILEEQNSENIEIIAKIESREAINNIDEIIKVSDGIMVARGDLGVEIPPEEVPIVQKQLIKKCNLAGKPVITATQMLESMINNPRATRAEASDVANAIFDGSDAVMLSGETAAGKYPVESVKFMSSIAEKAEAALTYEKRDVNRYRTARTITDAISHATVTTALDLGAAAIITSTKSGYTARMVSKYRPKAPIIAVTPDDRVVKKLCLIWGVYPLKVYHSETTDEMIERSVISALESNLIKKGDLVVITAGIPVGVIGTTNMIKVHIVGDVLIKGTGVGFRPISGKVWVARTPKDAEKMPDKAILVTYSTDKEFIPVMKKAAAVITVEGGLTSHAAVVGLELGIPVIVGAEGATQKLSTGSIVTVDPQRGLVYKGITNVK